MKEIEVKFCINDQQEAALLELLVHFQQYENKETGSRPFADWTLEDLFKAVIQAGSMSTIWRHIKNAQYMNGLITGAELVDDQNMTVAERKAARAAAGIQEADNGEETS